MKFRSITFTAVCAALLATTSLADPQAPGLKGHRGHRGNPVEHMTKNLDLTADQQAKIQPIIDQAKPQIVAIRQEAMQKTKTVRENTMSQIRPILTPEQQQKFEAMQKAREDMRNARRAMREAKQQ